MLSTVSVFFDFNLPNSTTWFYFSWLLAMALFFKFSRLLSVRNWDVVTLFLLVPGLLFLQQARPNLSTVETNPAVAAAALVADNASGALAGPVVGLQALGAQVRAGDARLGATPWLTIGYLWLLCGSAYFLLRCLLDLALVQRPALAPNLSFGGLAWLCGALFICLVAVAFRQPDRPLSVQGSVQASLPAPGPSATNPARKSAAIDQVEESMPMWGKRTLAVCFHLIVAAGMVVVCARQFQDALAGMAAATFYFMLPYTGFFIGQLSHIWPMAFMVWALLFYRWPILAGFFLGLASGTTYFPALVLPVWLSFYRGRGAGRFLVSFVVSGVLCLLAVGFKLWFDDELFGKLHEIWAISAWQAWRVPMEESFWMGVHWAYRIPVFVAYVAFLITTAFWPTPKNLAHVIALSAAVLIGVQFWYADQGGIYILWYLPYLLLLVFRPNLADRRPAPINAETDWICRLGRLLGRIVGWILRLPQPMTPAH